MVTCEPLALEKVRNCEVMWLLTRLLIGELVSVKKCLDLELRLLVLCHAFSRWFALLDLSLLGQHIILRLCDFIYLLVFGVVGASVWVDIMRLQVLAIDNSAMGWLGVCIAVLAESRFAEICLERGVGEPSCLLFEFLYSG